MMEGATGSLTSEEIDAKKKARMERFGAEAVEEAEKDSKNGWKLNRRKQKEHRKGDKDGKRTLKFNDKHRGDKHHKGGKNHGGKPGKRFKKGN